MDSQRVAYIGNLQSTFISFVHRTTGQALDAMLSRLLDDAEAANFTRGLQRLIDLHRRGNLHLSMPAYTEHCLTIMSHLPVDFWARVESDDEIDRLVRANVEGHA